MRGEVAERFWSKVDVRGPDECWEWTAGRYSSGYGAFSLWGRTWTAHRVAYMLARGKMPEGLLVCHTCDNRGCVNPRHLYAGSHLDNNRDARVRGRIKPHGRHKLTDEQVEEVRRLWVPYKVSQARLGEKYGVSHTTIWRALQ